MLAADPQDVARQLFKAIGDTDMDAISALLADDVMYVSAAGEKLIGKQSYLEAFRILFSRGVRFRVDIKSVEIEDDRIVVKGDTKADDESLIAGYFWHVTIAGDKVSRCQGFRTEGSLTLARVLSGVDQSLGS